MGDRAQVLVAIDCAPDDAAVVGTRVIGHLIERHIVEAEAGNSGLSTESSAHAPGEQIALALDDPLPDVIERTRNLHSNGVEIVTGRIVFDNGDNGLELRCAACDEVFMGDDAFFDAVGAWVNGDDEATAACPGCGFAQLLVEWTGPWPWGFGHLGVEFWNWPDLSEAFVQEIIEIVGGRVQLVRVSR